MTEVETGTGSGTKATKEIETLADTGSAAAGDVAAGTGSGGGSSVVGNLRIITFWEDWHLWRWH